MRATGKMLCALLLVAATTAGVYQLSSDPEGFVAEDAQEAVAQYADILEKAYLYPEIGKRMAGVLRAKLASGGYASFPTREAFAQAVQRDVKAIQKDSHLSFRTVTKENAGINSAAGNYAGGTCPRTGGTMRSMGKSGWLAPGIAYVEYCANQDAEEDVATLRKFLSDHRSANTLIIDNRGHIGGGFVETSLLFSHLYAVPTELLRVEFRASIEKEMPFPEAGKPEWRRLPLNGAMTQYSYHALPAPIETGLRTAKVFVLTSPFTASGGESSAAALKESDRAVLIGERTVGAGHLAPSFNFPENYRGQVSIGRIFYPANGQGYEGVGVEPHVKAPAARALEVALRMAGANVEAGQRAWSSLPTQQAR